MEQGAFLRGLWSPCDAEADAGVAIADFVARVGVAI
jgi:hypothetical protein